MAMPEKTCYLAGRSMLPDRLASAEKAAYIAFVQANTVLEDLAKRQ